MRNRATYCLLLYFCLGVGCVFADPPVLWSRSDNMPVAAALKPIAIFYMTDGAERTQQHAQMVQHMIKQARSDFGLTIQEYGLAHESDITARIDKIADGDIGLIVIVEPHDMDTLMKIPPLYPDIHFSIIGVDAPLYFTNVNTMIFNQQEGMFMIGTLAALHSKSGTVSFASARDDAAARNLAYAYFQGAKYASPEIQVSQQLGKNIRSADDGSDIEFILDDDLLEQALHTARDKKRLLIAADDDLTRAYPGIVLTGLLRHYDLALYTALGNYRKHRWRAGTQMLGLDGGYLDYVLDNSNKALLPKELIDKVEMTKDLVSQGVVPIIPLQ